MAGVRVFDEAQLEVLRAELAELADPAHPGHELFYEFHSNESEDPARVLFHALGAWRVAVGFHDLLWNPRFLVPAAQLLGGPVRFWHDQLFCKPARHGGVVAWHQDYSYWTRTTPLAHLTCWAGLDDSTRANGCVHYVPGSHLWPDLPVTGLAGDMDSIMSVGEDARNFRPGAIESSGEAFHHPLMITAAFEEPERRPRRATSSTSSARRAPASDAPPLDGGPHPEGRKLSCILPLLFERAR